VYSSLQACLIATGTQRAILDHTAEVIFPPLPQPFKAGTQLSDPIRMQG